MVLGNPGKGLLVLPLVGLTHHRLRIAVLELQEASSLCRITVHLAVGPSVAAVSLVM